LQRYDAIVIGAGHNGLVCATYLARSGRNVLILEAADAPGGLAAFREFHSGFRVAVAHTIGHFSRKVADELDLVRHGFDPDGETLPIMALSGRPERPVVVASDELHAVDEINRDAYARYLGLMQKFAAALRPFWHRAIPRLADGNISSGLAFAHIALRLRRLGKKELREFLRVVSLPMRDLLDEHFSDERLKAALCWDGIIGSKMAPRSPNNAVLTRLFRMADGAAQDRALLSSSPGGLVGALCQAANEAGAEIRCSSRVDHIQIDRSPDGLAARGVLLASGEHIAADLVVSAADPKRTFLGLVGTRHLEIGFSNRIRRIRCEGLVGKLHLALDGLPKFEGLDHCDGRLILAPSMEAIERAYDEAKYGNCPDNPVMEAVIPSLRDASLAKPGSHVLSAHVTYVPFRLKGGWTDSARSQVLHRLIEVLAVHAPAIRQQIVHAEFLTPADLETRFGLTGGHWHHGEFALDQLLMMRPTYGAAQYATPIPGLYLCSAGCHPGGDLTGIPGHNAARRILS